MFFVSTFGKRVIERVIVFRDKLFDIMAYGGITYTLFIHGSKALWIAKFWRDIKSKGENAWSVTPTLYFSGERLKDPVIVFTMGFLVCMFIVLGCLGITRILSSGATTRDSKMATPEHGKQFPNNDCSSVHSVSLTAMAALFRDMFKELPSGARMGGDGVEKLEQTAKEIQQLVVELQDFKQSFSSQFSSFMETLSLTLPSSNFLAYTMDELTTTIENKFENLTDIMSKANVMDQQTSHCIDEREIQGYQVNVIENDSVNRRVPNKQRGPRNNPLLFPYSSSGDPAASASSRLEEIVSESLAEEYAQMTPQQLLRKLQSEEKKRREEARKPRFLNEEERLMDMDSLDKKWKEEERALREQKGEKSKQEQILLGSLSKEEKELSVTEIRKLIRQKKYENWVRKMTALGVELDVCKVCNEFAGKAHRCLPTNWVVATKKGEAGIPVKTEIIVTNSGSGGIKLRGIKNVDEKKLQKQYEAVVEQKRKMEEEEQRIKHLLRLNQVDDTNDSPMINDKRNSSLLKTVVPLSIPELQSYDDVALNTLSIDNSNFRVSMPTSSRK